MPRELGSMDSVFFKRVHPIITVRSGCGDLRNAYQFYTFQKSLLFYAVKISSQFQFVGVTQKRSGNNFGCTDYYRNNMSTITSAPTSQPNRGISLYWPRTLTEDCGLTAQQCRWGYPFQPFVVDHNSRSIGKNEDIGYDRRTAWCTYLDRVWQVLYCRYSHNSCR